MLRAVLAFIVSVLPLSAFELPAKSSQCVVGTAKDWNTSTVTLITYEKRGGKWMKVSGPWQGRLGRDGLVWGRSKAKAIGALLPGFSASAARGACMPVLKSTPNSFIAK
jgi:hypothetical protein